MWDSKQRRQGLLLAIGLAFILMAVSFAELLPQFGFIFDGDKVIRSVMDAPLVGTRFGNQILWFGIAHLALNLIYGLSLWLVSRATVRVFPQTAHQWRSVLLAWFLISVCALFMASASRYPWSIAGEFYGRFLARESLGYLLIQIFAVGVLSAAIAMVLAALGKSMSHRFRATGRRTPMWLASGGVAALALVIVVWNHPYASPQPRISQKPHIILIGIDSLRRDATSIAGDGKYAPNISAFLRDSLVFQDAITPLARTFPSWVSILSGRHPRETGAVINLIDQKRIHVGSTLPELLRRHGYQTIFGMDEVRFANIDESFGFDQLISPPMGASDFVLNTINDTPLSNLIVNTTVGRWLFPNSYGNRAAAPVYDPYVFSARIENEVNFSKPTFMAVHFTLPHYPYVWADAPPMPDDLGEETPMVRKYHQAVTRADQQFARLMEFLKARGVLDNALVVVLSDHGEALNLPNDILLPLEDRYVVEGAVTLLTSIGHGTSVFSPPQFSVVLAMKGFGAAPLAKQPARSIAEPASVEDIAPTILQLLELDTATPRFDGRSLAGLMTRGLDSAPDSSPRIRFTETEFNPPQLKAGANAERALVTQNAKYYQVNPVSGRLQIREERLQATLQGRQFAAIGPHRMLTAFPSTHRIYKYILVDRDGRHMQVFDTPPAEAQDAEARALWQGMEKRYGSVIAEDTRARTQPAANMSSLSNQI